MLWWMSCAIKSPSALYTRSLALLMLAPDEYYYYNRGVCVVMLAITIMTWQDIGVS